ncbi:MAG: MFS transporter [Spirochaetaceae bacterium]|nr:MAG: MFS transporter [Spirochaetaceae bacterium]
MKSTERLRMRTQLGYGAGDLYGGGAFFIVSTLYLVFLTDVMGVRPALAGLVVLIARGWDAVSDPVMGMITDRTRTRMGRRRPYFLLGMPFIVLSFVFLWYPAGFAAEWARFSYALVTYLFFSTVITMVMIPYNALASELTLDYGERSRLTAYRLAFSELSTIICALVPLLIIDAAASRAVGYPIMGLIFGLFFALPFLATFLTTSERPDFTARSTPAEWKAFAEPFRNRTFRRFILIFLFSFAAIDIVLAIIVFFVTHYLRIPHLTNLLLGTLLIVQLVLLPLYYALSRRYSKIIALITGAVIWIIAMLSSLFLRPGLPIPVYFVFAALVGSGTGGVIVMAYAIFPDIPDVDELVSGRRREGIFAGVQTFLRKLTGAFAVFLVGQAIDIAGYVSPTESMVNGAAQVVIAEQSQAFITVLRVVFAAVPIVFIFLTILISLRFPLSREVHGKLKAYLAERRANDGKVVDEAYEKELRALLFD